MEQNINTDFFNSVSNNRTFSQNQTNSFTKKNLNSLACLNRMNELNSKSEILNILVQLLGNGNLDRQLIAATIRSCGSIGEKILNRILQTTNDFKI